MKLPGGGSSSQACISQSPSSRHLKGNKRSRQCSTEFRAGRQTIQHTKSRFCWVQGQHLWTRVRCEAALCDPHTSQAA
eukprot:scaffold107439_cov26-Tisochrysis_lutea.AAC.2